MFNFKDHAVSPLCEFLGNRFVYAVISQRAGGLLLGVEMNPDQKCNFKCVYCDVKLKPTSDRRLFNMRLMSSELKTLLQCYRENRFKELPVFSNIPDDLLKLKGISLSGEGEPTLCPRFSEVVEEIIQLRNSGQWPEFKIILITNGTGLDLPTVQPGLELLSLKDEIWIKLDGGTDERMERINRSTVSLDKIIENIVQLGQWRPVMIQSLFCSLKQIDPTQIEIDDYIQRLQEIRNRGAVIRAVQVYSIMRPPVWDGCDRLSLAQLSRIAKRIRSETGLHVEVY